MLGFMRGEKIGYSVAADAIPVGGDAVKQSADKTTAKRNRSAVQPNFGYP